MKPFLKLTPAIAKLFYRGKKYGSQTYGTRSLISYTFNGGPLFDDEQKFDFSKKFEPVLAKCIAHDIASGAITITPKNAR